jgi:hypothetical protein
MRPQKKKKKKKKKARFINNAFISSFYTIQKVISILPSSPSMAGFRKLKSMKPSEICREQTPKKKVGTKFIAAIFKIV